MINFLTGPESVQGSPEWLKFREGKIGSSMAASIMGVGFMTPLELFESIVDQRQAEVTDAMQRGKDLEDEARQWLNKKYSIDLQPAVIRHPNPEFDWHISSLDGIFVRPDGSIFVCEIKCPGSKDHELALSGQIPEKYIPQLNHILEDLPDTKEILYYSYHPDSQACIWYQRDEHELHEQFGKEFTFYLDLLNLRPPAPTEHDWVSNCEPNWVSTGDLYCKLSTQKKQIEAEMESLKKEFTLKMGHMARMKFGRLKMAKIESVGRICYDKIPQLQGVDLEPFRGEKIVSYRTYQDNEVK